MNTLLDIMQSNLTIRPLMASFWVKSSGQFYPITTHQMSEAIVSFGLGLRHLGVKVGDHVGIVSGNRPEWVVTDFAVMGLGGCVVPVYPTLTATEMAFILKDSACVGVVVETEAHLASVLSVMTECPALRFVVFMGDVFAGTDERVTLFSVVKDTGKACEASVRQAFLESWRDIKEDSLATIVYTSGTTGNPKGVCLTHRNIMSNVRDILDVLPITDADSALSFLPLSHVFERTAGYYTILAAGGSIYYAQSIATVTEDLALVHPTVMVSVPRLYEKVQAKLLGSATGLKGWILRLGIWVGRKYGMAHREGQLLWPFTWVYGVMDWLVYSKLRTRLGGRLRFFVSGGAPLHPALAQFFLDLGILIIEGYGMTETSPVLTCNRLGRFRFGSVGLPLPGVTLRLGDGDELLAKGDSMSAGYYNRPDATTALIDSEGWLHTGDVAKFDSDGFVYIVDRIKELIVLSNGKKVPPQVIEGKIKTSRYVSQVMVVGDNRHYLTAIVVPDFEMVRQLPCASGWDGQDREAFVSRPEVILAFEQIVMEKLADVASYEQVKKCRLLASEWTVDAGELTPSLKLKRKVVLDRVANLIEGMYAE